MGFIDLDVNQPPPTTHYIFILSHQMDAYYKMKKVTSHLFSSQREISEFKLTTLLGRAPSTLSGLG